MSRKLSLTLGLLLLTTILVFSENRKTINDSKVKREFRGAWIHTVGQKHLAELSKDELQTLLINTLDTLKAAGCNAVIFQVRPQADAFYKSELEPTCRFWTGEQGVAPEEDWDPLEFMIEQSHHRGMELHAWCNPYRVTSNDLETLHPDHLYFKKPELFLKYGKQIYFDPAEPEAREHTVKVIADITRRYDVDAIHFDDYFYPYPLSTEAFPDDDSFEKYAKEQGFNEDQRADWRRNNVDLLIKELSDTIKTIKPWVRFGISPFGIFRNKKDTPDGSGSETNGLSNYDQLYADVVLWAKEGWIDYLAPQLYWVIGHPRADYKTLIKWWDKQDLKSQIYVGQSIETLEHKEQFKEKIDLVRNLENIDGNVWWPGWWLVRNGNDVCDSLRTNYQKELALIPAYKHIDKVAPKKVKTIIKDNNHITWTTTPTKNPLQEASFYAIYIFPEKAKLNTREPQYLYKITKDNTLDISDYTTFPKGAKIVITVLDRCWNESKRSRGLVITL